MRDQTAPRPPWQRPNWKQEARSPGSAPSEAPCPLEGAEDGLSRPSSPLPAQRAHSPHLTMRLPKVTQPAAAT